MSEVLGISTNKIANFFSTFLGAEFNLTILIDILLTAGLIYWIYIFLKQTRAIRILYGFLILGLLWLIGQLLYLSALNYIMRYFITIMAFAVPVIFQPELRSLLEKIGRSSLIKEFSFHKKTDRTLFIDNLSDGIFGLKKLGIGALIAFERKTGLRELYENGVPINAVFSPQLLISIFTKGTPLHDGALVIRGSRIIAASVMIPLSDTFILNNYGMRHRAGISLTTETDAIVVIVSEEKKHVSIALDGELKRNITQEDFKRIMKKELFTEK